MVILFFAVVIGHLDTMILKKCVVSLAVTLQVLAWFTRGSRGPYVVGDFLRLGHLRCVQRIFLGLAG